MDVTNGSWKVVAGVAETASSLDPSRVQEATERASL